MEYHNTTVLKVGSLSVSYTSNNASSDIYYSVIIIILGFLMLIYNIVYYSNMKSDLIEYFELCPFCNGPTTAKAVKDGVFKSKIVVRCRNCGAKWDVSYSRNTGHIKNITLKIPCDDGRGSELVNKKLEPDELIYKIRRKKEQ